MTRQRRLRRGVSVRLRLMETHTTAPAVLRGRGETMKPAYNTTSLDLVVVGTPKLS
jgi:hypothetical protein